MFVNQSYHYYAKKADDSISDKQLLKNFDDDERKIFSSIVMHQETIQYSSKFLANLTSWLYNRFSKQLRKTPTLALKVGNDYIVLDKISGRVGKLYTFPPTDHAMQAKEKLYDCTITREYFHGPQISHVIVRAHNKKAISKELKYHLDLEHQVEEYKIIALHVKKMNVLKVF